MIEPVYALTRQLQLAWNQAVVEGKLINQFEAATDDLNGRWRKGDAITFGIRHHANKNIYYAQNLSQSREIEGAAEEKQIGELGFICQFNGYRALRPGGAPKPLGPQPDISPAPDQCRFSCQNSRDPLSLLVRDPLLQQPLKHFTWRAYYNAAPIDPNGHLLWVPTVTGVSGLRHFPQALTAEFLEDAIALFAQLDRTLLFFNALHAGASVNHIHFQSLYCQQPLLAETWPLTKHKAKDYAQLEGYPARVMVFSLKSSLQTVYAWIDQFQQRKIPFNLMLVGDRIILIPRNIAHEIVAEFPGSGIAALGMCGKIITVNRAAYLQVSEQTIRTAFKKMTVVPTAAL